MLNTVLCLEDSKEIFKFGSGGFSTVKCHSLKDGRWIAIKLYDREKATLRADKILMEKLVLTRLQKHDHIIDLLGTGKSDDSIYFILEPIFGGELNRHIIIEGGNIDPEIVSIYTAEIVSALCHMAKNGCVHRDLKSKNCILNSMGKIKICDFGSSKLLSETSFDMSHFSRIDYNSLPFTHTIIGTPHVMAPEMVNGQRHSYMVDWYALGVLMFEMLYGYLPPGEMNTKASASNSGSQDLKTFAGDFTRGIFASAGVGICGGNMSTVIKSSSVPNSAADDIISKLLHENPAYRLGILNITELETHAFFNTAGQEVDWSLIQLGTHRPGNPHFDRRVGFLELIPVSEQTSEETDGSEPALSAAQQALFEGF